MPNDIRFDELRKHLESHGWQFTRTRGSHHVFTRPGFRPITIPVHKGRVKHVYKRLVEKAIQEAAKGDKPGQAS
ncbi:MAG: type II toxin-antitoxin system HicA family toxin [Phycisphaerales bacterium]